VYTARLINRPEFRSTDLCRLSLDDSPNTPSGTSVEGRPRLLLLYFFTLVSHIMSKWNPFFLSGKYNIFVWPKTVRLGRRRYRSARRPANTNTRRKKGRSTLVALGCRRTRCRSFRERALCASVLPRVLRSITRWPIFPARGKLQRRRRHASGW